MYCINIKYNNLHMLVIHSSVNDIYTPFTAKCYYIYNIFEIYLKTISLK